MCVCVQDLHGAMSELSKRVSDPLREPLQELFWFTPSSRQVVRDHQGAYNVYQEIVDLMK